MSDSRGTISQQPRHRQVPKDETRYDVMEFATIHGLSIKAAQIILQANGPSRHKCDAGARAFLKAVAARNR